MTASKTLFVGDLEAQHKVFKRDIEPVLSSVNAVVQLGNMISCTEDAIDKKEYGRNFAVLEMWQRSEHPNLIKLAGPNEIAAINTPEKWTNFTSDQILRDEWLSAEPNMWVAISDKDRLVTHGGLTHGEWVAIGRPTTAQAAAEALQQKYQHTLHQGNAFLLTGRMNSSANPIWAHPVLETYTSWLTALEECPFDQIHGGPSLNREIFRAKVADQWNVLHHADSVSYRKFGSVVTIRGAEFKGIDLNLPSRTVPYTPPERAMYLESFE